MSRIYRALEKAEEEKRQKGKEEPSLKVFEEKVVLKKTEGKRRALSQGV